MPVYKGAERLIAYCPAVKIIAVFLGDTSGLKEFPASGTSGANEGIEILRRVGLIDHRIQFHADTERLRVLNLGEVIVGA